MNSKDDKPSALTAHQFEGAQSQITDAFQAYLQTAHGLSLRDLFVIANCL